jgi:colicin import membrane protein
MSFSRAKRSPELPPERPPTLPSDRDFDASLKWSAILHVLALLAIVIKSTVFPGTPTPYVPTLRVDIVGLPDILKKDLKDVSSTKEVSDILKKAEQDAAKIKPKKLPPIAKTEPVEPDDMALKPKPADSKEKAREKRLHDAMAAMDRIKALAKLARETSAPQIKGNKISKGTSLSGDAKESDQQNYYDSVLSRLRENWALPMYLSRQNLSAQVQICIDARGRLHSFRFVKGSGNTQFDDAVKRALEESAPFPVPPGEVAFNVLVNGIIFGFPL